jgi:hypothetical protein
VHSRLNRPIFETHFTLFNSRINRQDTRVSLERLTTFAKNLKPSSLLFVEVVAQSATHKQSAMLRDALMRESQSKEENPNEDAEDNSNAGEPRLDGEDFNVINHEDVEDVEEEEEEEEEEEHSFYRPGLAGFLGGRMMQRSRNSPRRFDNLHPFTQVLSISNVDDCVNLENEVFPESERCSRDKVTKMRSIY